MTINYSVGEERANSLTHLIGFIMILSASLFFIIRIPVNADVMMYLSGVSLYFLGAGASYLSSSLYHSSSSLIVRREKLRRLDHAAIYWHIAGSYSPILLYGMSECQSVAWLLFSVVWICAVVGSFVSFRGLKEHSNWETFCFVCMGLVVLLAFDKVLFCIGWQSMSWIIAEGVAFIVGAIFYSFNKIKYMHTVFHIFVLTGSACHIMALNYILK